MSGEQLPGFSVVIPARFTSTRLPGKPLRLLAGTPLIEHVARRALTMGATQVVLATDDTRIAAAVAGLDVRVVMTRADHASGSDRLAECAAACAWPEDHIVVNLQGDEPFVPAAGVHAVVAALAAGDAAMATLATPINEIAALLDPNVVKLVCDRSGHALYFSRAPVPWARDALAHDRAACRKTCRCCAISACTLIAPVSCAVSRSLSQPRWNAPRRWSNCARWSTAIASAWR
ncbi:3-deoxy-D-manno-octulosonate cytidylyltransferase [mine drainage metagenome]|uniref:3-deoxy-D-manno-octulosonate cytidylyltransferase n=2 Tax=mine drainage metagenome TaxID=410659 RepID=T0ZRL3_9ZZZZ